MRNPSSERGQATLEVVLLVLIVILAMIPVIEWAERGVAKFHRDASEVVSLPVP
ncbi:MAG: hypothetical protein AAB215_09990 [Planctomycetota bacterium]